MPQVLYKVIRPEKFLGVIALSEIMPLLQMQDPHLPILICCHYDLLPAQGWRRNARPQEFFPTIST
jgi:hypothetical protein